MIIHPRSVIGCPVPPSTRPKLVRVNVLLGHHVGFTPTTRYRSADDDRVLSDAKAAAAYGISSNRSWEYSYMIGLNGWIFEQGGQYRAAHCLNLNGDSAGVVFLNADDDVPVTQAQVDSWWWLRAEMASDRLRILTDDHEVAPHYRYRTTSCPGLSRAQPPGGLWESPTGQGRLGNLIPALTVRPTPDDEDDDMADGLKAFYVPGPAMEATTDIVFAAFQSGIIRHGSGPDVSAWGDAPRHEYNGVEHFNQLARAANKMAGADITLLPE